MSWSKYADHKESFFWALYQRDYSRVDELLQADRSLLTAIKKPNLFDPGPRFDAVAEPALHWACGKAYLEAVEVLLKHGADVNLLYGSTPLLKAVASGNVELVRRLLEHGANVNLSDGSKSVLTAACLHTTGVSMVRLLLEHGADPNDNGGTDGNDTPFLAAVKHKNSAAVKLLLDHGATVNVTTRSLDTPLSIAVRLRSVPTIKLLLQRGAAVNVLDNKGYSPLARAVVDSRGAALQITRLLIKYGADVNQSLVGEATALILACQKRQPKVVRLLLAHGADVNAKAISVDRYDYKAKTPLLGASAAHGPGIIAALIAAGADVNGCDDQGVTPLISACSNNSIEAIRALLKRGADINLRDQEGRTPFLAAAKHSSPQVLQLLLRHGANVNDCRLPETPLVVACRRNDPAVVACLLENGANVNMPGEVTGETPLLATCGLDYEELSWTASPSVVRIAMKLTRATIDPSFRQRFWDSAQYLGKSLGSFALDCAHIMTQYGIYETNENGEMESSVLKVMHGQMKVFSLLLRYGANVNLAGRRPARQEGDNSLVDVKDGSFPLHLAAVNSFFTIMFMLLDRGAQVDVQNTNGDTPLLLTVQEGLLDCASCLLERGADIHLSNQQSLSPFLLACQSSDLDFIYRLIRQSPHQLQRQLLLSSFETTTD